jgi:hypothetical protein
MAFAVYIIKRYLLRQKEEELWKTQKYFTMQKYTNLQEML